ncbi:dihydropyrimidinase [Pseudoroseomonas cervicalis]|uniref:dihydropyrimidinase n=1 Tax=Teichococcus cervicalis TaxID=204525 RepID=UPI00277F4B4D|nr:dihydropyrimidinase [Pseudoroseomonas cervicalis]MDQ1079131.1 dihydropyrimidinase [Pseudoroseomonas cervicalis]
MNEFDLVVRGGTLATAAEVFEADIGIRDGRIAALGLNLPRGREEVSAKGLIVTPGGLDSHCHLEEMGQDGSVHEESFASGSAAALAGGTTSFICFLPQWKGHSLAASAPGYEARAAQSRADYSFHQIITDPTPEVLEREVPALVARGIRSLKVFLTYDPLRLTDAQFLEVLATAKKLGAFVTVHCENFDAIGWRIQALLKAGLTDPLQHAWSRPPVVEREATHRAIALAELVDQPIQVFHVSCEEAAAEIARAKARGLKIWGETCPQYFTLDHDDLTGADFAGAKAVCSPALREKGENARIWRRIQDGTLDVVTSDHCGFSFATQKRVAGGSAYGTGAAVQRADGTPAFNAIPNGVPGIETRLPVLFSEGVSKGRIDLPTFVRLSSANAAALFGLAGRKGSLAPGADADLVLWDPDAERVIRNAGLHHAIDYTPWEGLAVKGWPSVTIRRGEVAVREGEVLAQPGSGRFLPRGPYALARPRGVVPDGFDAALA